MSYISEDFYDKIARRAFANIKPWTKIGYSPAPLITETDVWSYSATQPTYLFPTTVAGLEVLSSNNTQDIGTVIKGNAQGASAIVCDAGGSATTLNDADVDFTAATAVAIGDVVLLDAFGTTPEWGYVTGIAQHTLTIANGFSSGGSCALARAYSVVDKSAYTGAQVVKVDFLDGNYAEKSELIILNGTTVVPTVLTTYYRINSFRVIAAGTGEKPVGNLFIRNLADTPVYSYITLGYTRARNTMYTVPAGKTLYVTDVNSGFSLAASTKWEFARVITRANVEPATSFNTGNLFYAYQEIISNNATTPVQLRIATRLPAKTDIKLTTIASVVGGTVTTVLRGYLETT